MSQVSTESQAMSEREYEAEMLRKSASMIRRHLTTLEAVLAPALVASWAKVAESKERLAEALTMPALQERAA